MTKEERLKLLKEIEHSPLMDEKTLAECVKYMVEECDKEILSIFMENYKK